MVFADWKMKFLDECYGKAGAMIFYFKFDQSARSPKPLMDVAAIVNASPLIELNLILMFECIRAFVQKPRMRRRVCVLFCCVVFVQRTPQKRTHRRCTTYRLVKYECTYTFQHTFQQYHKIAIYIIQIKILLLFSSELSCSNNFYLWILAKMIHLLIFENYNYYPMRSKWLSKSMF